MLGFLRGTLVESNIVVSLLFLSLSALAIDLVYKIYFHPLAKYPGPPLRAATQLVNLWQELSGTATRVIPDLHDRYGSVVRIAPDTLSFNTPGAWRDIYGSHVGSGQLPKDQMWYFSNRSNHEPPNIINANDADHARYRKLVSHAFSDHAIREQEPLMTPYFDLLITRLKEEIKGRMDGVVNMTQWYNFTTFDIIGDLTYARSFGALRSGTWDVNAARKKHREYTSIRTLERLASNSDRKDFMAYIRRVLLLAGTETSATLLTGATFYLTKHPETLRKLTAEVREAFASPKEISIESTLRLPYLHAVIEESLRLYPPAPVRLPRRTGHGGAHVSGVFIPPDTSIGVHQLATFTSSALFHNARMFVPERWMKDKPPEYANDKLSAVQPFHVGPRNCVGRNLAYAEIRSILARMVWHFDMELCESSTNWNVQEVFFVFWQKSALNVKLSPRKGM